MTRFYGHMLARAQGRARNLVERSAVICKDRPEVARLRRPRLPAGGAAPDAPEAQSCRVGREERVRPSRSFAGPASSQGRGKGGLTPPRLRVWAPCCIQVGMWVIDAIRAENPRGAPTCTCLPTSGPKPPARDPLPALPQLLTHICAAHLHTLCT